MADSTGYGGLSDTKPDLGSTDFKNNRWQTTGMGDFPAVSIRPTSATNGFMFLRDAAVQETTQRNKIKLWVHEINIGWSMDYRHAQTVYGKSFYPRHIQYSNAVIRGQTASQQHYDEIVDMVLTYQSSAIVPGTRTSKESFDIVRFEMPAAGYVMKGAGKAGPWDRGDDGDDKTYYRYDRIFFDGYPIKISAGHKKGVFNPEFEITFLVGAYKNDLLASGTYMDSEKDFKSQRYSTN